MEKQYQDQIDYEEGLIRAERLRKERLARDKEASKKAYAEQQEILRNNIRNRGLVENNDPVGGGGGG
jgi:hypothetical protein